MVAQHLGWCRTEHSCPSLLAESVVCGGPLSLRLSYPPPACCPSAQFGTYQTVSTVVAAPATPGAPETVQFQNIFRFGLQSATVDSVMAVGSIVQDTSTRPPTRISTNMAIVGGTGSYLGATGDVKSSGSPSSGTPTGTVTFTMNIYVPNV